MDASATKTATRKFVSAYLARVADPARCVRIEAFDELVWIEDLLSRHPAWPTKGAGVEWIGVHRGHFCLVRDGGRRHEDISFHKCLTPATPRQDLLKACRHAIQVQSAAARARVFGTAVRVACALCDQRLLNDAGTHMDHVLPFVRLFDEWLGDRDPASIATVSTGTGRIFAPAASMEEAEWTAFHAARATFRALCADCNLRRPRKGT